MPGKSWLAEMLTIAEDSPYPRKQFGQGSLGLPSRRFYVCSLRECLLHTESATQPDETCVIGKRSAYLRYRASRTDVELSPASECLRNQFGQARYRLVLFREVHS